MSERNSFAEAVARTAAARPVAVTVLAIALVVLGTVAWRDLPLDLLPDVQSPTVVVSVRSGDRPPTEMERLYGEQVEQRLFTVAGIRSIEQVARTGRLIARVTFDWDADMDVAVIDVQKAVSPMAADVDVDEVLVRRFDPRQEPVLVLGLIAPEGRPDLAELRRAARRQLAPAVEQLDGVAQVRVIGGRELEVQVTVDRYRLEAYGLTVGQLAARLEAANVDLNAGTLEEGDQVLLVRGVSRYRSVEDVREVVIRSEIQDDRVVPIRVRDVASVQMAPRDIDHLVRVDGIEGVGLEVYKEAGANTVAVSESVQRSLDGLASDLPGVEVRLVSDAAALVSDAISDVEDAAIIGICLAIIVLALFLRSPGPTIVVAAAVPVSLLTALLAMKLGGLSLNLMTLAGLALGAGMLVDNAIVVVESIFRRRVEGDSPAEAAARGTGLVAGAITASTLTTCVVFLPVLFVQGLAARLVSGIAFTVVVSLLASLLVAVLVIPALSRWFLPRGTAKALDPGRTRLERFVATLLRRPLLPVAVAAVAVGLAVLGLLHLGTELMPPADPRELSVRLIGPPGQRVEATAEMAAAVESIVTEAGGEWVRAVMAEVGRVPEDDRTIREEQSEENTARIRLRLAAGGPGASAVVQAAAPAVARLDRVEATWELGGSALGAALGTGGPPVVVEIMGRSLDDLREAAAVVRRELAGLEALWNVRSSFEDGPPELRVHLRRAMADGLGVDLDQVAQVLSAGLDGQRVTTMSTGDEEYEVVVHLEGVQRGDLARLPLTTAAGTKVEIGDVASFEQVAGAREVFRRDQRRVARVTARIVDGVEYPEALASVRRMVDVMELAPGLRVQLMGEEAERIRTLGELEWAGLLALLLVLMVLAGTFESLLHPLTVLSAVPLALVGVAAALVPLGKPVGVMAALGAIVLAGIAVNDAILLVETARQLQRAGMERAAALARAAAVRLRPIMMTTATTVLALAPLALAHGEAAALRRPLALVVIGGILASTVGSLLVVPCLYALLDRLHSRSG